MALMIQQIDYIYLKKLRGLNNVMGTMINNNTMTNSINNIISFNKNKRSPLAQKNLISPSDRFQKIIGNYIKNTIKNKLNINNNKETYNDNNNNAITRNKFYFINKKNKQTDTNNKKMKFIKK